MQPLLLSKIENSKDFRSFSKTQLLQLVEELRNESTAIAQREGHWCKSWGSGIDHCSDYVFDTPNDILCGDVATKPMGTRCLQGEERLFLICVSGEASGFPKRNESVHDPLNRSFFYFTFSDFSMAIAAQQMELMCSYWWSLETLQLPVECLEALNHLGTTQANVLIF